MSDSQPGGSKVPVSGFPGPAQSLEFPSAWMNAAGTLGFAPPAHWPLPVPPAAFVTNPISYRPRKPAQDRALLTFPGGFLLHTGLPSPGFREVIRQYAPRWSRSTVPVWMHLLGDTPAHLERMARQIEELEGVTAVELSFADHAGGDEILEMLRSVSGELPVALAVPLDRVRESWLPRAATLGLAAISLSAPRGVIPDEFGRAVHGRLFGPALLPQVHGALEYLQGCGLPVVAGGGVMRQGEIDRLIDAGAACVQLDFVLWRGWLPAASD